MALFSSYRWRYGRRSRGRYARSRSRRRSTGNATAARGQRDAATVTISRIATYSVVIAQQSSNAGIAINHWNSLRLSSFYGNYEPMYDQVKIDKIRVKVTGSQSGSAVTANISPSVVLAFDRNGLEPNSSLQPAAISTYSSAQVKQWSTGNAFVMYQTIYPSTIMEKGQYIPTAALIAPTEAAGGNSAFNPCYDLTSPTIPFKPITLLGVDMGSSMTAQQGFAFTIEFEYTVTFRGMRKPTIAYSDSILVPLSREITTNGTYAYSPQDVQEDADGFSSVSLIVNVPQSSYTSGEANVEYTSNGTYRILPSEFFYHFLSAVNLTINVQPPPAKIIVDYVRGSTNSSTVYLQFFDLATQSTTITIPYNRQLIVISDSGFSNLDEPSYRVDVLRAASSASSLTVLQGEHYHLTTNSTQLYGFFGHFAGSVEGVGVFEFRDLVATDNNSAHFELGKSVFLMPWDVE